MSHYRSEYRSAALSALAAHERFAGFTALKVWPGAIDDQTLPVIGVLTPQDSSRMESFTSTERKTLLQVVVRRAGGSEVEDTLDQDSEYIEAIILSAIRGQNRFCFLRDTSLVSNTNGIRNIGTLVMSFEITSVRPEAVLSEGP